MYRETDPRALAELRTHLGLATALLEQFVEIPRRLSPAAREELRQLEHEARNAWESLWDQLGQARNLARALGRDTTAYDAARRAAADIWLDAARIDVHSEYGKGSTYTWRCAPTEPAQRAIDALRAAVPEIVVSEPPPQELELRRAHKRITTYGPLAVVIAAVTWALVHFLA